ncbi:MAG: T9SS type A sorting domain-containing protein [Bacteroidetes bacterium]|nr:T9SS type A sorting domain-containing protein [Bacteroidota bacterium]
MKIKSTFILLAVSLQLAAQPCIPNTNSLQFDGVSSFVTISPQTGLDITGPITIEAWINPSSFGFNSAQNSIVCKHGWSSGEGGFVLRCGGTGELSFNIAGIDVNQFPVSWVEVVSSNGILSLNNWYHVAGTYDGNELKCFVDGNLAGTTAFQGTIAPSTSYPLALGRLADPVYGPDRYFSGAMDEVRIWSRALSQSEIMSGMNNHIDPSAVSGLVSYWRMNEGANSTVYDVAGTNNGGLVFSTWNSSVPFNAVPASPVISYNGGILYSSAPAGNQWYLGGTPIAGATMDNYTPTQNGVYAVEVTSPEGCTVLSVQFTVLDVAVSEINGSSTTVVYPNPMHDVSNIVISSRVYIGTAAFILTDLQGRSVKEIDGILVSSIPSTISIDRKDICNGIYFYALQTTSGILSKGKLIIE